MRYSISEVAKFSGVTARTLRHYDAVGLLTPSEVGANGYRFYGRAELMRLQRILVLRRLGLGLETIAEVLSEQTDEVAALRGHLADLQAERARLDRIIATVQDTVADLTDARIDDPARFFIGLREDRQAMRQSYRATYGDAVAASFDTAEAAQENLTAADYEHAAAQGMALFRRLADVMRAGVAPDDPKALDAVHAHYASLLHFWQPTPEAYAAMGTMYRTDQAQRAMVEKADHALPEWLAAAIEAYAARRLRASHTPPDA